MIASPKNFIEQFQNFIEHIAGVMKTFLTKEVADNYYLSFTAQTLNEAQKTQARINIGAASQENFANYLPINGKAASAITADSATTADSANYANSAGSANSVAWVNVSGKPAIPAAPNSYITQSWRSGNNWYLRFSNGFIMQGGCYTVGSEHGAINIGLHTAFSTASYTAIANLYTSMQSNYEGCGVSSKWTTGFSVYSRTSQTGVWRDWIAFGY